MSDNSSWVVVNGWTVLAHPMLLDQIERLIAASAQEHTTLTQSETGPNTKLLGHLTDLVRNAIPRDPGSKQFRHGGTLGGRTHWFRTTTGNGRYRLFYRFDSRTRTIILVCVNDERSLRTYGGKTDAYKVFNAMLDSGNPPDSWEALKAAASDPRTLKRLGGWLDAGEASAHAGQSAPRQKAAAKSAAPKKPRRR